MSKKKRPKCVRTVILEGVPTAFPIASEIRQCKPKYLIAGIVLAASFVLTALNTAKAQETDSSARVAELSERLYASLVREARSLRLARQPGYRAEVWNRLKQAEQLPNADLQELRAAALGCMGDFIGNAPKTVLQSTVPIVRLAMDDEGTYVATAHVTGEITIVDRTSGKKTKLPPHSLWTANELHFAPNGKGLYSVHRSGVLHWQQKDGKWKSEMLVEPNGEWKVDPCLTQDGRLVAYAAGQTLTVLDTETEVELANFKLPFRVHRIAMSPQGKWVAAAYDEPTQPGAEPITKIGVVDLESKKRVAVVEPRLHYLRSLAFSSDGNFLACGCMHGVAVYNAPNFHSVSRSSGDMVTGTIAFRPGTTTLAIPSHQESLVKLIDVQSTGRSETVKPGGSAPYFIQFSGNGRFLATANSKDVNVWDLASGAEVFACDGHNGGVTGICFSPDGKRLYSTGKDATIRIWDAETGVQQQSFRGFAGIGQCIAVSPDGTLIATGDYTAGTVQVWDVTSGEVLAAVQEPFGARLHGVAFSPDGRYLAAGSATRGLRIFNISHEVDTVELLPTEFRLRDLTDVGHLCFSPNSKLFAWTTNFGEIHVWDLEEDVELPSPGKVYARIQSLAFLPDSQRLAFLDPKFNVVLWDVFEGKRVSQFPANRKANDSQARSYSLHITASPDGRFLATSAVTSRAANVWDTKTGKLILPLPESSGTIWCMAFTADAKKLAVSRSNGKLRIWNLPAIRKAVSDFAAAP